MADLKNGKEMRAVIQWKGEPITITFSDIKNFLCPLGTMQEIVIFLKTCQSLNLNPWAEEIYLIKYSERDKAATVIAIDAYLKAAETNAQFDGYESGIILRDSAGKLDFREGAFLLDQERANLVGGWAKVYRKDRNRPYYMAVNIKECLKYTKDGHLTQFWTEEKQPSMVRKVALKRALVEAFASLFSGAIASVDYEVLPQEVKEVLSQAKGEMPEGELPPAFEKQGEPDWAKFWAKVGEMGFSEQQVHQRLGIQSVKDWLAQGKTLEDAMDILQRREELEIPSDDRIKGWMIVQSKVKELGLSEKQVAKWWQNYGITMTLAGLNEPLPPDNVTNQMLSTFVDMMTIYRETLKASGKEPKVGG